MYGELVKRRLGEASKQQPTRQQTSFLTFISFYISGKEEIFHFAKYRFFTSQSTIFSLRKVQIFHFAKYRFFISFRFVSFRKVQ